MISAFARQVTEKRRAMGYTQSELAGQIGCKQSALSMFERGNAHALAQAKIAQLAETLELVLPALPSNTAPGELPSRGYCPLFDCPANQLYLVQGALFALPRRNQAGSGPFCRYCGERLESRCPGCGHPVQPGACCNLCGTPYVPTPTVETDAQARDLLRQHPLANRELPDIPTVS